MPKMSLRKDMKINPINIRSFGIGQAKAEREQKNITAILFPRDGWLN